MSAQHDSETVQTGQQVITVCAVIHKEVDGRQKIFMPKRAATKKFLPNVFELPGGHVDYGEDLVSALKREIQEELLADVVVGEPFAAFTYINDVKHTHSVEIAYFATFANPEQQITLDPEDHSEYVWIAQDEMDKVYTETKGPDDDEMVVIRRAFEVLNTHSR